MLKRIAFCFTLFFIYANCAAGLPNKKWPEMKYESAEHVFIGNQVKLAFKENTEAQAGMPLKLSNGLELTYGEIVALAGDFYGNPDAPISLAATEDEKKERFLSAYATLALDPNALTEVPKILNVLQEEEKELRDGMKKGQKPADIYALFATDHNMAWNCITGGMCIEDYPGMSPDQFRKIYYLQQGRYLKLADTDFDHFGKEAVVAYTVGHTLALEKAIAAGKNKNTDELMEAYTLNAFACHFLTDEFSSGHMRTPHLHLYNMVYPSSQGSVLAAYMHNEDSEIGLNVVNARGDSWRAFGDRYYFDPRNTRTRNILQEAMQLSVDQLFTAYLHGKMPEENPLLKLLPDLNKLTSERTEEANASPLFYWDEDSQNLMRRRTINDPQDYQWTADWNSWETLDELQKAKGPLG